MGLFKRQNIVTRADKISEFTVNTAEYGSAVPEVIGTTRIGGNVIYYDDFTAHEHKETHKSGKGGGTKQTNITYTYTVAVIFGLCEGTISGIGKVWRNKEVYTYPNDKIELTCFKGTQNQQPWAYVVGKHPEKAMPYAGLAYMAGVVDMGTSASLPQFNFEVKGKLLNTGNGVDANPADYIRYVLDRVGLSNVPIDGLSNYRSYCYEAGLLVSSPPDGQTKQAQAIINDLCKLTNAYFFWSNDRFKIVPVETHRINGWIPDNTIRYNLTADDFLPQSNGAMVTYSRKDSAEVYNSFPVEFINRANSYEKETVNYQLSQDILEHGLRQAPTTSAHYFYTKERAVKIAEMLARKAQLERNTYTFKLDWAFCRLEPADIVTITDPNIGVNALTVRIISVTEDAKGAIVCSAVEVENVSGAAEYDVHEVDRPYVDYNAPPSDITQSLIMQPPADLTNDGLELWIGATGGKNWGGCTVWVSDDNINYRSVGQLSNSARIGTLQQAMSQTAKECVVSCNDVLISGTEQDAERGNTLCWIGGECLSYTTATLVSSGVYRLSGLVRGQYNTSAVAHSVGEQFARLDNTLLKESFHKEDIGKQIYLKFTSFNIFGAAEQELSEVNPYQYTLQAYYVPPVKNVTAYNRYRQIKDGVARYDIVVKWNEPELESYLEGRVWYKTQNEQVKYAIPNNNVKVSEIGFSGDWIFGGSGKNNVVIPQAIVGDTYRIAVTTMDIWGVETSPDVSPQIDIKVALKTNKPNTPDGFGITFGETAVAYWNEVSNTDIAFYELRLDQQVGVDNDNFLERVTGITSVLPLVRRNGTIYLYAYSASGYYSYPAVLQYNKPAPPKPQRPTLTAKLGGFAIETEAIPDGCNGVNIYIDSYDNNVKVHSINDTYTHMCDAGGYTVTIAFTDMFGEGERSDERSIVIKAVVDSSLLEAEAVTKEKLSTALQTSVDAVATNTSNISALATRMTTAEGTLSADGLAITQNANNISSLTTRMTDAESDIADNGLAITQNTNSISSLATRVSTAEGTITTHGTEISQNADDISAVAARVTTAEGSITTQGTAINQNASAISSLATRVTTAEGTITTHGTEISQNADDISSVAARVTTAEGTITTQGTSITQNASDISAVATRMTTAEGNISTNTTNIGVNADGISAIVTNLNDSTLAGQNYTAIQAMQTGIASKVALGDVTSYFQQSHQGFLIEGSLIHISGDTLIDNGVVTADMIQAGAITADAIYQAGYKVKNITFITGNVACSTTVDQWVKIPIPNDYTPQQCVVTLTSVVNTHVKNLVFDTCVKSDGYTYVMLLNVYRNPGQPSTSSVSIRYQTVGIK